MTAIDRLQLLRAEEQMRSYRDQGDGLSRLCRCGCGDPVPRRRRTGPAAAYASAACRSRHHRVRAQRALGEGA